MGNKIFNILLVLLFISVLVVIILFNSKESNVINNNDAHNNVSNNITNITSNTKYDDKISLIPKVVCEGCHLSGKSSIPQAMTALPHINGGNYCLVCHKYLHDRHPINKDVTCEKCHGYKNESIPVSGSNIVCINCHDYPNPLNKSLGNLLTIHRPRNVSCINCHAKACTTCHKEMGSNERWEKRLIHFKTIMGAIPYENPSLGN